MTAAFSAAAYDPTAFDSSEYLLTCPSPAQVAANWQTVGLRASLVLRQVAGGVVVAGNAVIVGHQMLFGVTGAAVTLAYGVAGLVKTRILTASRAQSAVSPGGATVMTRKRGVRLGTATVTAAGNAADLLLKLRVYASKATLTVARNSATMAPFVAGLSALTSPARRMSFRPSARRRQFDSPTRAL